MNFVEFKIIFQQHVAELCKQPVLFVTSVNKDTMWETYLESFPEGTNEIYRERRVFDCSCCRQFVKQFGNVVSIVNNKLVSIWDFNTGDTTYQPVIDTLSTLVKSHSIQDVFVTKQSKYGTNKSREQLADNTIHTWDHFHIELPTQLITKSNKSEASLMGEYRDSRNVFKRSLEEISPGAVETVLDLVLEKSLYRGDEWQGVLVQFRDLQSEYNNLPTDERDNYCWKKSLEVGGAISKIRNQSIGTLLQNLTDKMDVAEAVRKFEAIVAPTNYKRPKPVFTRKMVEDAQKVIENLGLTNSLPRRHAVLADVTVNDVLWSNKDAARYMNGIGGVFESLLQEVTVKPKQFKNVPGMGIEEFIEILSTATSLEVLLENQQEGNLVSLIAPQHQSPSLFKWGNNFSWAYKGNIADSMKSRVKAAGGDVTGVLRFSIQWNENGENQNDFDAHCVEPNGNHIYYPNKTQRHRSSGMLDVDIQYPGQKIAVENITWSDRGRMSEGIYHLYVHNYAHHGGTNGFTAEIEFDRELYEYEYRKPIRQGGVVTVAKIKFTGNGIEFIESLPSTTSSKNIWGLSTSQFHPVSLVCYSPNYWDGRGVGNRHYMFMLANCVNPDSPNGFYNEFLKEEFMQHKRVFAALGNKMKVEHTTHQLSGIGFSSTKRNSVVCKVDKRVVKIIF